MIDSKQVSYEKIVIPPERNIGNNLSKELDTAAIGIDDIVTTKETYPLPESESKSDDASDPQMQEEPTIIPSTKTVVTENESMQLILDDQSTNPGVTTNVDSHDQCHSGHSVNETIPTEAQDSGNYVGRVRVRNVLRIAIATCISMREKPASMHNYLC